MRHHTFLVKFHVNFYILLNFDVFLPFKELNSWKHLIKKCSQLSLHFINDELKKSFFMWLAKFSLFKFYAFLRAVTICFKAILKAVISLNANSSSLKIGKWWNKYKTLANHPWNYWRIFYFQPSVNFKLNTPLYLWHHEPISFSLLSLFFIIYHFLYKFGEM